MHISRRLVLRSCAAIPGAVAAPWLAAQPKSGAYPTMPIRLVVGFVPGGSIDAIARLIATGLSATLGQPVIVENKPGASGMLAAELVAKAKPDGHTLMMVASGHVSVAASQPSLPLDPIQEFSWVSTITSFPLFVVVRTDSPIRSFADLVAQAKAAPGKLSYPSPGIGTGQHLAAELIWGEMGIRLNHIPYKGAGSMMTDLLGGHVDVMVESAPTTLTFLRTGRLRGLATTSKAGEELIPGVPQLTKFGGHSQFNSWIGVVAPAAVPKSIIDRLNLAIARSVQQPEIQRRISELGGDIDLLTAEKFRQRVDLDYARYRKLIKERNIVLE